MAAMAVGAVAPELAWADAQGNILYDLPEMMWAQRQAWTAPLVLRILGHLVSLLERLYALVVRR